MKKIISGEIIEVNSNFVRIKITSKIIPNVDTILKTDQGSYFDIQFIEKNQIILALILKNEDDIFIGQKVFGDNLNIKIQVGSKIKGRMFNFLGELIDFGKPIQDAPIIEVSNFNKSKAIFKKTQNLILTGIKAIDFFMPIIEANKIGVFGGAGVGKTLLMKEIMNSFISKKINKNITSFVVGIGERSREGRELFQEIHSSNIKDQTILYFAQMNETASARKKVIYTALSSAEYMCNVEKNDILFFVDNIYRFVQASSEVSSSLGNLPSRLGYQPSLQSEIASVQERLSNSNENSITSFQTVFVPGDDITDPANIAIFSHLDCYLVLDRKIAAEGRYPAINPLSSSSNNISLETIGKKHFNLLTIVKKNLQKYDEIKDFLSIFGIEGLGENEKNVVYKAQQLQNYFTQNLFYAEKFTQQKGIYIDKEKMLNEIQEIVDEKYIDIDPYHFLYVNDFDDIRKMKKEKLEKNNEKILLN